jgi:hypothetical protein
MRRSRFLAALVTVATIVGLPLRLLAAGPVIRMKAENNSSSSDDTGRLQAAIDQASDQGGTVILGAGTYRLSAPLQFSGRGLRLVSTEGAVLGVMGSSAIEILGRG